jgi:hypothetical protein
VEGLADLLGRETVRAQLNEVITVLAAEQNRRDAGSAVRRPVWKNLVFTGGASRGPAFVAAPGTRLPWSRQGTPPPHCRRHVVIDGLR